MIAYRVRASWLTIILLGTPRIDRSHGPNLDALKELYQREFTRLNWVVGFFVAALLATFGSLVARLIAAFTVAGPDRTFRILGITVIEETSRNFGTNETLLSVFMGIVVLAVIGLLAAHHIIHAALRREYLDAIARYFLLNLGLA